MPVYTYAGNLLPGEKTERLVLRGGALTLNLYEWADLTLAEYEALSTRYRFVEGAEGTPAETSARTISFFDLREAPAKSLSDAGKAILLDEDGSFVLQTVVPGRVLDRDGNVVPTKRLNVVIDDNGEIDDLIVEDV